MSKVSELRVGQRGVNIDVKVIRKGRERRTLTGGHRVADVLVGDETGCVLLTLWNEQIDEVSDGDCIRVESGFVSMFKGSVRLNVGRQGRLVKSDREITNVNLSNNISARESYGGGGWGYRRRPR